MANCGGKTVLGAGGDDTISVTPTINSFPSLELHPTDELGDYLASKEFATPAKASITLEMLRSGTYKGHPCALILLDVSFFFDKGSRLQSATVKVTFSGSTGTKQSPSLACIAPRQARGAETHIQHNEAQQYGGGLTTPAPAALNISGNVTRGTTYSTSAFTRITSVITFSDRRHKSIQNRAEFIIEENAKAKLGIPSIFRAGLIVLLEKGDDKFNVAIHVDAKQGWGPDAYRFLTSLFHKDSKESQTLVDPSQPIEGPQDLEQILRQSNNNNWAELDLNEFVKLPKIVELPGY
jgi:hypothetical protein